MTSPNTPRPLLGDEPTSASWDGAIVALRYYRETIGTVDVPSRARAFGLNLGKWVARCRDDYWLGALGLAHTRDLEATDDWHWGPDRPGSWRHAFNALTAYAAEHHTTVLIEQTTFGDVAVQNWSNTQRQAHARGALPAASVELLEGLPDWQWDARAARWTQGLTAARRYVERHLSLVDLDHHTRLGDFPLGRWLQRCREDHRAGTMPPAQSVELEALSGWSWKQPSLQSWCDGLEALQCFASREGHAAPAQGEVIDGFALGWWVTRKRRNHRTGTLGVERASELEALPGWQWDPNEHRWQRGLAALEGYVVANGHANPARGQRFDHYPVGDWVRTQRTAHRNRRLSVMRVISLESVPGWCWDDLRWRR